MGKDMSKLYKLPRHQVIYPHNIKVFNDKAFKTEIKEIILTRTLLY